MAEKDFYTTLGIPKNATQDEIKKAYRKLAHQYHPDKGNGNDEKFKQINEAYQVLGDEAKRKQYDQFGQTFNAASGFNPGGFQWSDVFRNQGNSAGFNFSANFDFGDILENVFGFNADSRQGKGGSRGKDLVLELAIPFEESILGGKETIEIKRTALCRKCNGTGGEPGIKMKTCTTCQGKGNVQKTERTILGTVTRVETCPICRGRGEIPTKPCDVCDGKGTERISETIELVIPRGITADDTMKLSGKGEISDPMSPPGDLYVRIKILPHKTFRRQADNLIMQLPIKVSQAILGDSVTVETLEGKISLKIPGGTQSGDILRVRGKGVPEARAYGHGDLLIEIRVEIPRKVSKRGKEAIESLKEEGF
ncbi:MAG: molecular chaperone DnaJ [Candidatus Sungbacteria bacterium]|uniref:Chaperone protein DnaJ n=1 Tax=Candidatus Sungiibacteriota bacterium TaxID=2750080 RepID=A0A9D6LMQ0_9BACT|nr:molecular chaperone DnaJ [Candidatus Sungbacteria bacterium]